MNKSGYVYILFNKPNGTLYVGVTSNLIKRVFEHKQKYDKDCFTAKYSVDKLGYYEVCNNIETAIILEKHIKSQDRHLKLRLITKGNPFWKDLYDDIV